MGARSMPLGRLTIPQMDKYAWFCGADLQVVRTFDPAGRYPEFEPHWALLELIRWFAEESSYDALLYLDLDVMVMPVAYFRTEEDVFEQLQQSPGFYAEGDMGIPFKTSSFAAWVARELKHTRLAHYAGPDLDQAPADDITIRYFNSGVLMMDKATARKLTEGMPSMPFVTSPGLAEQGYLNALADRTGLFFRPLSDFEDFDYNWVSLEWPNAWFRKKFVHMVGAGKLHAEEIRAFCDAQERVLESEFRT